jgi:hypothetical protein
VGVASREESECVGVTSREESEGVGVASREESEGVGVVPLERSSEVEPETDGVVGVASEEGSCSAAVVEPEEVASVEELVLTPPWYEVMLIWCEKNSKCEELVEWLNTEFAGDADLAFLPSGW